MTSPVQLTDLAAVPEAKAYGLSESFIRKCFISHRLTKFSIGSRVYFSRRELAAMVVASGGPQTKNDAEAA